MASQAAKLFVSYMEAKNLKVSVVDEEARLVKSSFSLDGTSVDIYIQFGEDECDAHFEGRNFINIPKDKEEVVYKICNVCNDNYRWVKFVLDEDSKAFCCRCDAVIQLDSCAAEVYEIMMRICSIIDNAYPKIMKALWAD